MKDLASRRSRFDYSRATQDQKVQQEPETPGPSGEALPAALPNAPAPPALEAPLVPTQPLRINPSLSVAASSQAQNAVSAAKTSGDYRFQSVSDVVRAALERYFAGSLSLTQQAKPGPKKRQTVQLSAEMMAEYQKLPTRSRGEIVERALLTFLGGGFGMAD